MKKKNMKIKKDIKLIDQFAAINYIVDYYFTDGEYTPYYATVAKHEAVAKYFIDGITFEEEDIIYDCIVEDKKLLELVNKFNRNFDETDMAKQHNEENKQYLDIMDFVIVNVNEKLEFEKQKVIHNSDVINYTMMQVATFVNDLDSAIANFSNLELSKLTPEVVETSLNVLKQLKDKDITPDVLSDVIKNAVDVKIPESEMVDGLKEQIGNLQNLLNEERKENNKLNKKILDFNARNVISDK